MATDLIISILGARHRIGAMDIDVTVTTSTGLENVATLTAPAPDSLTTPATFRADLITRVKNFYINKYGLPFDGTSVIMVFGGPI